VVNSSNVQVNAELGIVNQLQARIRNLGITDATGAVVRFRFAPFYAGIPDSAFELIGTVTVNVPAGGAPQIVPINWNLTNLSDTNGGIWPGPISSFTHFCVRVDIEYPSDINLSNNDAQNNFFDVTTAAGPMRPIRFLIGNPFERAVTARIVTSSLPKEIRPLLREPVLELPVATQGPAKSAPPESAATARTNAAISLKPREIRVGTITLTKPPASITEHLTHDLVIDVSTVIDGRPLSGFSVLLARAKVQPRKPEIAGPPRIVSKEAARAVPPQTPPRPEIFEMAAPMAQAEVHQSIAAYLTSQKIKIDQNDPARGLVTSAAIPLNHQQLLNAITEHARGMVPTSADGFYFVTFKTTPQKEGAPAGSHITVSTRILVKTSQNLDSPLGGRLLPTNGSLERSYLTAFAARFHTAR